MENEDNVEAKVIQHEKNYTAKKYCKLLRKKNGISPWKETEAIKNKLEANENDQHTFEERNEGSPFLDTQEASQALSPSREDNAEEFNTELTVFNDLVITSDPVSYIEYVPYYRTYTSLLEMPLCINPDEQQEDTEKEDELQSNGCAWKLQYEDEPLYDFDYFPTGYFPCYRTCEEYFSNSELPSDLYNTAEIEEIAEIAEPEANTEDQLESEIDCEIVGVCEDIDFQEKYETQEDKSWCLKSPELIGPHHILTDSLIEPCDSDTIDEIFNVNQVPFISGYFPYYRTYGKLLLSPISSSNIFCSSRETWEGCDIEMEGTGEGSRDNSKDCAVCCSKWD